MLTYYCPNCWATLDETEHTCPRCGYALEDFNNLAYEGKLLVALRHPVPERRVMAAQILGNLGSHRAIPKFLQILQSGEDNYFFLRAILLATIKINHPDQSKILRLARQHPSRLVKLLAEALLDRPDPNRPSDPWDRHTG